MGIGVLHCSAERLIIDSHLFGNGKEKVRENLSYNGIDCIVRREREYLELSLYVRVQAAAGAASGLSEKS